jgi:ABC-type ATPase involved in cell division
MTELYRFLDVRCEGLDRTLTFTLHSGETRLLQLADKAEKDVIIDFSIGESVCDEGYVEIAQGDRRSSKEAITREQEERRHRNAPVPVIWQSLQRGRLGRVGWVAANGGLISNLKIWENVTLPLWYHGKRDVAETEQRVIYWLAILGLEPPVFAEFMASLPHRIEPWQRKLAGMLRALLQMPPVLIVDAGVFEDVAVHYVERWITALETYASQGYAVLVLADRATQLPWEKIE